MDEEKQIAIGVPHQMAHRLRYRPDGNSAMRIGKQKRAFHRRALRRGRLGVEGAGTQRACKRGPAGGRMAMIKMRCRPIEAVAADLALEHAFRQVGMRLAGGFAFDTGKLDPVAGHRFTSCRVPRRIWSASMLSNKARKLPSPKPSLPLRWICLL